MALSGDFQKFYHFLPNYVTDLLKKSPKEKGDDMLVTIYGKVTDFGQKLLNTKGYIFQDTEIRGIKKGYNCEYIKLNLGSLRKMYNVKVDKKNYSAVIPDEKIYYIAISYLPHISQKFECKSKKNFDIILDKFNCRKEILVSKEKYPNNKKEVFLVKLTRKGLQKYNSGNLDCFKDIKRKITSTRWVRLKCTYGEIRNYYNIQQIDGQYLAKIPNGVDYFEKFIIARKL